MKTTSLEISKLLKAAGYPQDSYWYWAVEMEKGRETGKWSLCQYNHLLPEHPKYPSPSSDEILDQLPERLRDNKAFYIHEFKLQGEWFVEYYNPDVGTVFYETRSKESLADAAALMWLYLKKEHFI